MKKHRSPDTTGQAITRRLRLAAQSIRMLATSQLGDVAAGCDTTSYTTDQTRTQAPPKP